MCIRDSPTGGILMSQIQRAFGACLVALALAAVTPGRATAHRDDSYTWKLG